MSNNVQKFFQLGITDEKTYREYEAAMKELREKDNADLFDRDEPALDNDEILLENMLEMERTSIVGNKHTYLDYPCANMFHSVKDKIEQTGAYQIFRRLPKGGNLHMHTSSSWDVDEMLYFFAECDYADCVYAFVGEESRSYDSTFVHGRLFYFSEECKAKIDAWNNSHSDAGKLVQLKDIPDEVNIRQLLTFSGDERMRNIDYIWDEFNNVFARVSTFLSVERVYRDYYEHSFRTLCEDNVKYVELRFGPSCFVENNDSVLGQGRYYTATKEDYERSIELIRAIYEKVKVDYPDFELKLIISGSRKKGSFERALQLLEYASDWINRYKGFVIGFDFVSEEDLNYSADYIAKALIKAGKEMEFYFHDGESNWADDDNVMSAVCLKSKRIGHGFNLYRFPAVLEKVKQEEICLEICPISNQELRYSPDLRAHTMGEYMKRGVPFVICSDDPQIFCNKGLTYDFWEFYFSQPRLVTLRSVKKVIRNSYTYSARTDKEAAINNWTVTWKKAVADILNDNPILACVAMFNKYYDEVLETDKVFLLDNSQNDMNRWLKDYRPLLKQEGIKDGSFFKEGQQGDETVGIGNDGRFIRSEYFNIMYQLFSYLYRKKQMEHFILTAVRGDECDKVDECVRMVEHYVSRFEGQSFVWKAEFCFEADDMQIWNAAYQYFIERGIIYTDENRELLISQDGRFDVIKLLHFLYLGYELLYYNYPWRNQ